MASVSVAAISKNHKQDWRDVTQTCIFPSVDIYTRPINFLVQGTNQYYSTGCGTILTLITYVLVILYAVYQIQLHNDNSDYQLNFEEHVDEYGDNDIFKSSDIGFHFAAGLTDFSEENMGKIIEDPTYGQIKFYRKAWGYPIPG